MPQRANVTFNKRGWQAIAKHIVETDGVRRMKRVADSANAADDLDDGYIVSTEGDDPLSKKDFRATVITASAEAMRSNAKRNTLVKSMHLAGGE